MNTVTQTMQNGLHPALIKQRLHAVSNGLGHDRAPGAQLPRIAAVLLCHYSSRNPAVHFKCRTVEQQRVPL